MLPDLKSHEGLKILKEAGYGFTGFDRPQNFKMQAEILDLAVKTAGSLTSETAVISDVAHLVLDSLFDSPRGFEFFPRFPKEEVVQFTKLAVASRENNLPLPITCPVCPDYEDRGYKMSDGIGISMGRVFDNFEALKDFFSKRNFPFFIDIHVADVEVMEPLILQAAGETRESFLGKTGRTMTEINNKAVRLGLGEVVRAKSMLEIFSQAGLDYAALKQRNKEKLLQAQPTNYRKIGNVLNSLISERIRLGDYDERIGAANFVEMVAEELADYATYGDLVAGGSVILSADASSAVFGYNVLRAGQDGKPVNPTIYLGKAKGGGGEFLYG
ncbi:MAG: hypothetical protein AAB580_01695 [Patescibacteria group bacterium]